MAWNFFQKFWTVLDFLQKPLAWCSNFYLRLQSKNCGRNCFFFVFLFRIFFEFRAKVFQTFGQETSRSCQNYPLRVQTNNFWLEIFFKSFEPFWIFCRNLWHGAQTSIFVSTVKIPEEIILFNLLFIIFSDFERIFFRLSAKKLQEVFKTTFCVSRGTRCGLKFPKKFESFWIFYRNLWQCSQNSIYVFRVKSAEEKFFLFYFSELFWNLSERFSDFGPKNFKKLSKLPSTCVEVQFVAWIFLKKFESFWIFCRNLWHGSQNSIYVSSAKIAEEMVFFVFLFRISFEFWVKIFQTFGQKTSRSCQNYPLPVQTNNFWLEIFFKSFEPFWIFCRKFGMVLKLLSSCPEEKLRKK